MNAFVVKRYCSLCLAVSLSQPLLARESTGPRVQLNENQSQILRRIDKGHQSFEISVLNGEINGRTRTVVLLGETHIKGKAASELGKEALAQFDAYGLEGVDVSKNWGGKVFGLAIKTAFEMYKVFSFGFEAEESTIYAAARRAPNRYLVEYLKRLVADKKFAQMSPQELAKHKIKVGDQVFYGEDMFKYIQSLEEKAKDEPLVFPLEAGHVPGLGENVFSVAFPAFVAWGTYVSANRAVSIVRSAFKTDYAGAVLGLAAGVLPGTAMVGLMTYFPNNFITKIVTLPSTPLINGRNVTMSSNIVQAFETHPDLNTLLVIVGQKHISGIKQLLETNRRFQIVPIEQLEASTVPVQARAE